MGNIIRRILAYMHYTILEAKLITATNESCSKNNISIEDEEEKDKKEQHHQQQECLLIRYEPLRRSMVQNEILMIHKTLHDIYVSWNTEEKRYEETIERVVVVAGKEEEKQFHPRRNYPNADKIIQDGELFPYHSSCYPLLDAYDCIYGGGGSVHDGNDDDDTTNSNSKSRHHADMLHFWIPINQHRPQMPGEVPLDSHMPNSTYALFRSLVPGNPPRTTLQLSFTDMMDKLMDEIVQYEWDNGPQKLISDNGAVTDIPLSWSSSDALSSTEDDVIEHEYGGNFGPDAFPKEHRADIVLKLMKHALSDLQADHRLALACLCLLNYWKCCDDISVFRRLLGVIWSEYINCDGRCEVEEQLFDDHYCTDWIHFLQGLSRLISHGITYLTAAHASCLCAFVQVDFDFTNDDDAELEHAFLNSTCEGAEKRKTAVPKQSQHFSTDTGTPQSTEINSEVDEMSEGRTHLIRALIHGAGCHATVDKHRMMVFTEMKKEVKSSFHTNSVYRCTVDSYWNSMRTLVFIGEISARRLPPTFSAPETGGLIVRSLVQAALKPDMSNFELKMKIPYLGRSRPNLHDKQIHSRSRYSDSISSASKRYIESRRLAEEWKHQSGDNMMRVIELVLRSPPLRDVQDIIRSLFAMDLVHMRFSGCGYGDFLVWTSLQLSPFDPIIFHLDANVPAAGYEYEDLLDYTFNEDNKILTMGELTARFHFTGTKLIREWNTSWSPQSHYSYQKPYRDAIKTLALCAYRVGMPNDIVYSVIKFLPRSWWPDERKRCWCKDRGMDSANELFLRKLWNSDQDSSQPNTTSDSQFERAMLLTYGEKFSTGDMNSCSVCDFAIHRQYDYYDGDGLISGLEDYDSENDSDYVYSENDSDEGLWESIESDEE